MAKYLASISHEIVANLEDSEEDREYAAVLLRQVIKMKPRLRMARRDLKLCERGFKNLGELVVIFQAGRGAIKVSRGKLMNDASMRNSINIAIGTRSLAAGVTSAAIIGTMRNAEIPIPRFKRRSNQVNHLRIRIKGIRFKTENLENTEFTAIRNLEADYGRLKVQLVAGIVVKAVTSIAAGIAAKQASKAIGGTVGRLSGLIGNCCWCRNRCCTFLFNETGSKVLAYNSGKPAARKAEIAAGIVQRTH